MFALRVRGALLVGVAGIAAACGGSGTEPSGPTLVTPSAVAIVSGNGQVGLVGSALSTPLVVKVTSGSAAVKGATVTFSVSAGAASVSPSSVTTDSTGQAKTLVTLGSSPGPVTISATVSGTSLTATFAITAGTTVVTSACTGSSPTTPALGGVLPGVGGSGTCLGGGTAGAEYALVAFNSNPDSTGSSSSITVRSSGGATGISSASSIAPVFDATPGMGVAEATAGAAQLAFDRLLRETARRELTPRMAAARSYARQRASFTAIPANPAIGATFTLNANGNPPPCSKPINVSARVAAVSSTAIVVADVDNPAGGFTDAEYAAFAATFDTLVSPVDVANFGAPSDVDGNGKTIIFFTKEVNRLTPRGGLGGGGGFIGGFFFERDLFPTASTAGLEGCGASNYAEIYYSLVPDPDSTINGNKHTKAEVLKSTPGTLAHEFQHLINAGRRLYVNQANVFETTWLNEGLSHIAEELLYYRVSGNAPRQNIDVARIKVNNAGIGAFNDYQADNTGRYEAFFLKPSATSVYGDNDQLETRGATWNLLRYLADHRGTADADTWRLLVNSKTAGLENVSNVFGTNYLTQIRDWATSVFADDLPGQADARFSQPSWNYRDIFPALGTPKIGVYPLKVLALADAAPVNVSVNAGGAAYIRFRVPAGSAVSVDWSSSGLPVSPLMQFTVVRSK
jgi:hypothetical protein